MYKREAMWSKLYGFSVWLLFGALLAGGSGLGVWLALSGHALWGLGALLLGALLALRSLSGSMLRREAYRRQGTDKEMLSGD